MEVSGQLHTPAALPPRERDTGTHWIGSWVNPRAGLDAVVKRKIPSSRRDSNPVHPIVQSKSVAIPTELFRLFSASILTRLTAGRPRFDPRQGLSGALSLGVKRQGCGADHSPPSSAGIKNVLTYTSTPPCASMGWCLIKQRIGLLHNCKFRP
jgi:hypothetical protein